VADVLIAAAFVPSPPLLVPELVGLATGETDELRDAVSAAASGVSDVQEWIVVGVGDADADVESGAVGTFAGFGADVTVRLAPGVGSAAPRPADPMMPLTGLIAGWLRGLTAPHVHAEVHVLAADTTPSDCAAFGTALRARIDGDRTPRALLIVADGATTLTPKAPGSFDPRAGDVEATLAAALVGGDLAALADLDPHVCAEIGLEGRAAWQTLAAVFGTPPSAVDVLYSDAPYGVGYHVGTWRP